MQWEISGADTNVPYDNMYPPVILVKDNDTDISIILEKGQNGWMAAAFDIQADGAELWATQLPADNPTSITKTDSNLAVTIFNGRKILALDHYGKIVWQWDNAGNRTVSQVATWENRLYLLLQEDVPPDPRFPWLPPDRPTFISSLDANTGSEFWIIDAKTKFKAPPYNTEVSAMSVVSGSVGVAYLAGGRGSVFLSYGARVTAFSEIDGSVLWTQAITTATSVGVTGSPANVTHAVYAEYEGSPPLLLLSLNNWGFVRHSALALNVTPPITAWRTRFPDNGVVTHDITLDYPGIDPNEPTFYFIANRTDWTAQPPIQQIMVVGSDIRTGAEKWATPIPFPRAHPVGYGGRVYIVTLEGLKVLNGAGGAVQWQIKGPPPCEGVSGQACQVTPTFSDVAGQLAVLRCLGGDPSSLCTYSGFMALDGAFSAHATGPATAILIVSVIIALAAARRL